MKDPLIPATTPALSASQIKIANPAPEASPVNPTQTPVAPPENLSAITDATVAPDAPVTCPSPAPSAASAPSPVSTNLVLARKAIGTAPGTRPPRKAKVLNWIDGYVVSPKHGRSFVVISTKGFKEVLAIGSSELSARIRSYFRTPGSDPLKQRELEDLNEELRSEAEAEGHCLDLYPRVRPLDGGGIEVDLADGKGTTVELTADGVRVLHGTSSTLFTRSPSALALPVPADHGDFRLLGSYVNLEPHAFLLYIAWLTFTIASPKIEATKYLFLVIKGGQGCGKTFASKTTQRLIDPNAVGVQTLPGSPRDLAIILQSVHLMVVDNLRDLTTTLSDTLCIAATGGSVPMRKLYTDDEQKALFLHGAMIFNGIHPFMGQSDFADRCMVLDLLPLPPEKLKSEAEMLLKFEVDRPVILRGLYDLIARVMRALPDAQINHPARMLDFCRWLAAMEIALGLDAGSLQKQYVESLKEAQLESLLDNPLAVTIIQFAEGMVDPEWSGTPSEFYEKLSAMAGFNSQRSRAWPPTAASMSKRLHGLQAPLLAQGIAIDWARGKDRKIVVQKFRDVPVKAAEAFKPVSPVGDPADAADGPVGTAAY